MKMIIKLYLITMFSFVFLFCKSHNPTDNKDANSVHANDQELVDSMHNILIRLNYAKEMDFYKMDTLLMYFREYENTKNKNLIFPKYDNDSELFYTIINRLYASSTNCKDCINYIFRFRFAIKRIVEWSEYLSELIHQVALKNPQAFIEVYEQLDNDDRLKIQNDLFWLYENNKIDLFLEKLNNINDENLLDEVEELKNKLQ